MSMAESYTFNDLCDQLGKDRLYVRRLQQQLKLPILQNGSVYSASYHNFLKKIIAMRTLCVSMERIYELLQREVKILKLLHYDALSNSSTWYLEGCSGLFGNCRQLLLTGYDLGFPIAAGDIQCNLNFNGHEAELFEGREMGEDINQIVKDYIELVDKIKAKAFKEMHVLESALIWLEQAF